MTLKLTHPNGGAIETTADKAEPYLSQGWVEVEANEQPAPTNKTKAK